MTGASVVSVWADKVEDARSQFDITVTLRVMADTSGEAIASVVSLIEEIA